MGLPRWPSDKESANQCKSPFASVLHWQTQALWVQFLIQEDPLEEGMATHSSTLAWKILWMKETGRQQSMGSQSWT